MTAFWQSTLMSTDLSNKKRQREFDEDEELEVFGSRPPPPAPLQLPLGYNDEANPFNDQNLSMPFKWKLKENKMAKEGHVAASSEQEIQAQREDTLVRRDAKLERGVRQRGLPCELE